MADDDSFEPRLGRLRSQGGKRARRYLSRVIAATNLARGRAASAASASSFSGSRIGRGSGVGRMLASRGSASALGHRRVIVKASIVKLAGKGAGAAAAHLRYLQRDGTTRDGQSGTLYGRDADVVDGKAFQERGTGNRHQFRFIVSPEDAAEYDDLKSLTRRLMSRIEEDLGTTLDWVAVDHYNTGHPHTHIVVRGKDDRGADLVIAREYLTTGIRERAAELIDLDLGPRSHQDTQRTLRAEVTAERLTSLDRAMLREGGDDRVVQAHGATAFDQSCRIGRLKTLSTMGLADPLGAGRWRLADGIEDTLRRMGERGDIIRTMQREITRMKLIRTMADQVIYDPGAEDAAPLVGRVVARGLADEHRDRHYLIVDATDGRTHYVEIGEGVGFDQLAQDAIVRIEPQRAEVRAVDRRVVEIAATNAGRYDIDSHLHYDPKATESFAEAHVRRLEALRRAGIGVTRDAVGTWTIPDDHLKRLRTYEERLISDRPVAITTLSSTPLDKLVDADAATWLDRELVASTPGLLRHAGFGAATAEAQARRRQWLVALGFAEETGGATTFRSDMLVALQRRELTRVAVGISAELDRRYVESAPGERVEGILQRSVDLVSGRFAVIETSREFTLAPWRPMLERHIGKPVSGVLRGDGITWSIGRGRSGPALE